MTQTIDEADAIRLKSIAPWVRKANREIERRIEDARAHAQLSLAPQPHPGYSRQQATKADCRLKELQQCLIGSGIGTVGLVQDARAAFYRQSHREHAILIPAQFLWERGGPSQAGMERAQQITIHGRTLLEEMEPVFLAISNSLRAAINASTSTHGIPLETWQRQAVQTISQLVLTVLSDSEVAIRDAVGRQLIKPELRAQPA